MKKFGRLNVVDILIVLVLILVMIGGGYYLLNRKNSDAQSELKTYTYVVQGQEVVSDLIDMPTIGQNMYNSATSEYLGTLVDFSYEESTETTFNFETLEYVKVPMIGYSNVSVTISGYGVEDDENITVEGTVVKVGKELNIKGKGYAFKGIIVEVRDGE